MTYLFIKVHRTLSYFKKEVMKRMSQSKETSPEILKPILES